MGWYGARPPGPAPGAKDAVEVFKMNVEAFPASVFGGCSKELSSSPRWIWSKMLSRLVLTVISNRSGLLCRNSVLSVAGS